MRKWILNTWANIQLKRLKKTLRSPNIQYNKTWKSLIEAPKHPLHKHLKKGEPIEKLRDLPLTDYLDYHDAFQESMRTKINPLIDEQVEFWCCSTGSTGVAKIFPISKSVIKSRMEGAYYQPAQLIKEFGVYTGPPEIIFVMPGQTQEYAPNLPIGQVGYYYYTKMPNWIKRKFVFPLKLYKNEALFNEWHILSALLSDISGISTSIPTRLTHFFNQLNHDRLKLLRHLKDRDWPDAITHSVDENRIQFLLKVLQTPVNNIKDIWPSLKFVSCWKAGEVCQRQMNELTRQFDFGDIPFIDLTYNAVEGHFNMPGMQGIGGPVNPFGGILEFYDEKNKTYLWPWELKIGQLYEILITNSTGLCRYRTYDLVECVGYEGKMAKIAFHSRCNSEISLGWANITETELYNSLDAVKIEILSNLYFTLHKSGNGLVLCSTDSELETKIDLLNSCLETKNENYKKQISMGTIDKLSFRNISTSHLNTVRLKNANSKKLILNE
ncbi:MAG: GH3 family domain-containing protein [Salibacteraceae bacterium]